MTQIVPHRRRSARAMAINSLHLVADRQTAVFGRTVAAQAGDDRTVSSAIGDGETGRLWWRSGLCGQWMDMTGQCQRASGKR
ncbi:MAG: hypothetical protein QHC67_16570 [Sphingobium sp.]|nr:hypothetical protein [Sphingobium sp.]MDX3911403.1 hypothetical protein [Sphingobium sp.]